MSQNAHATDAAGGTVTQPWSDEAQRLLTDIQALRRDIIAAWQARAVVMTREEQRALREEIRSTCALLQDLTAAD